MIRIYAYDKCSTCRKALKYLAARGIKPTVLPICERPPTSSELKKMLTWLGGDLRKLFNTSGRDYRRLKVGETLPRMTEAAALRLLAKNGNLVKRPFLLTERGGAVGFKEEEWRKLFGGA